MKNNALVDFIGEVVNEARLRESEVQLASGKKVPYGSDAHIADIENSIRDLSAHRDRQQRGSASRDTFARAIGRLKNQLKSAINVRNKAKHARVE